MADKENPFLKALSDYKRANKSGATEVKKTQSINPFDDLPVKKKDHYQPASPSGAEISGPPSVPFQNTDPFQTEQPLAPTVLTPDKQEEYTADLQRGMAEMDNRIRQAQNAYQSAQGANAIATIQEASSNRPEDVLNPETSQKGNRAGYLYNELLSGIGDIAGGMGDISVQNTVSNPFVAAGNAIVNTKARKTGDSVRDYFGTITDGLLNIVKNLNPSSEDNEPIVSDYRGNISPEISGFLKENIGADVDKGTEAKYQNEFITSSIGGLARSAPAMLTGSAGLMLQGYASALNSVQGADTDNTLDEGTKTIYAGTVGLVNASLEKLGLDRIFKGATPKISQAITEKAISEASKKSGGKVTGDALMRFINGEVKDLADNYAKFGVKAVNGVITEGWTGGAQETANVVSEKLLNASTGKSIFDTEDETTWEGFKNTLARIGYSAAQEAVGGGILGTIAGARYISPKRKAGILESSERLTKLNEEIDNPGISETTREVLVQKKIELQNVIETEIQEAEKEISKFTPEEKAQAETLTEETEKLETALADQNLPEDIKAELQTDLESKTAELETLHEEVSAREKPVNTPADETIVETPVPEIDEQGINAIDTGITDEAGPSETGNAGESTPADTETIIEQLDALKIPEAGKEPGTETPAVTEEVQGEPAQPKVEEADSEKAAEINTSSPYAEISDTSELAKLYDEEVNNPTGVSEIESAIAEYLGDSKINPDDFYRYGDRNTTSKGIGRKYFAKKGDKSMPFDTMAQEMNNRYFNGQEKVTPQDIADFIQKFPNGTGDVKRPAGNPVLSEINKRYKELTGKSLNRATAKKYAESAKKISEQNIDIDEEVINIIEGGDVTLENIDDPQITAIIDFLKSDDIDLELAKQKIKDYLEKNGNPTRNTNWQENQSIEEDAEPDAGSGSVRPTGKIGTNTQVSERIAPEKLRGSNANPIKSDFNKIRRSIEAAKSKHQGEKLSKHEQEDLEKRAVFDFAKENGLWVDDFYSLGEATGLSGNENTLALDSENNTLFKSNNLFNSGFLISNLLLQIDIHNQLFPESQYELVGFTGIDNGKKRSPHVEVILKQKFVKNASNATPNDIADYMQSNGFEKINDSTFTKGEYTVSDLHPRNVLKDENGFIHVVDDVISVNKAQPISSEPILKKAEEDLSVLRKVSPENKAKKYKASMDRLIEAKKNKTISEQEFNDFKERFDDVIADSRGSANIEQASQERKSRLVTERIKPERRASSNKPKKLNEILSNIAEKLQATLIYAGSNRRNSLGTYNPQNTLVKVRRAGDLDTAAHELGHLIDDRFNLLGNIPISDRIKIDQQLKWYSDRGGSNPPSGLDAVKKLKYLQNEGFGEFIRAYIVNPAQTKFQSPELFNYFESQIDAKTKEALKEFSDDVLDFENATYRDKTLANIEDSRLKDKNKFIEWLASKRESGEWGVGLFDTLNAHLTNSMHIAEKAFKFGMDKTGISKISNSENFEMLSRLFAGVNGKVIRMLENGLTNSKNEKLEDKNGNPMNLEWLLSGLDNTSEQTIREDMDDVIALLAAERTVEYAKKFERTNNLTGIGGGMSTDIEVAIGHLSEFEQLKNTNKDKYDRIKEAARKYRDFADAGLRYAVEKGRISEEQYQQIKEGNKYYVSLARTKELSPGEEPLGFINEHAGGNITSVKDVIKKAKGGSGTIKNPYLSLIKNTVDLITESDRNEVMQSFVKPFTIERGMNEGEAVNLAQVARQVDKSGNNTKAVFIDGEKQYWQFQSDVYESISSMERIAPNALIKALSIPGSILRFSVTNFPVFALRNIVRDTQSRLMLSRTNSGIRDLLHNKTDRELFDLYGGSQGGFHLLSKNAYAEALGESISNISKSKNSFVLDPRRIWKGYTELLGKSENVNRIAEFNKAYKQAKSEGLDDYNAGLYAAYQARDLMDFAKAGHTIRAINQIIPFTNAAVQGLVRAGKSIKENPVGFSTRLFLYTVLPQMVIRGIVHAMGDDDEYEQLPAFQRDLFWNFRTPWTGDKWISIPRPFELGLPSAMIDRAFSKYLGNEDAFAGFNQSLINSLSPFDESSMMGGFRPFIEIAVNHDTFRDNPIVPYWEQDKLLKLRKGAEYASNTGKMISKAFGLAGAEVDPRYIDHFIRSQTSYYGDLALRLGDFGKKDSRFGFGVGQTGFMRDAPVSNAQAVKDTYELATKLGEERSKRIKRLRNMIEDYYSLETSKQREDKAKEIYKYASEQRERLEKELEKVKNDKE